MAELRLPLVRLEVSKTLGSRYLDLAEDGLRTVVIQLTVQLLMSAIDGDPFFSGSFWLVLMYIVLGTAAYHLLVRQIIDVV